MSEMLSDKLKNFGNLMLAELSSPVNIALIAVSVFVIYKITASRRSPEPPAPKRLPKMKKRDFTLTELTDYNGVKNERILIGIRSRVFDVTNRGKDFYGPGGPYEDLAGRDASRALATFSLSKEGFSDKYDDLSDLDSFQVESLDSWEAQFLEKYDVVGKLLKPGEEATDYDDEEQEQKE